VETGTAELPAKDGFWRADPWRTAFILLVPLIIAAGLAGRRRRRKPVKPRRVR
jgi:MYXO-CTERM domain-containing protein